MVNFKGMVKYFTNSIILATKQTCIVFRFVQSLKLFLILNQTI